MVLVQFVYLRRRLAGSSSPMAWPAVANIHRDADNVRLRRDGIMAGDATYALAGADRDGSYGRWIFWFAIYITRISRPLDGLHGRRGFPRQRNLPPQEMGLTICPV